jgi:hypothetical protein
LGQKVCNKPSRLANLKCFILFNLAAVVGFLLGFASFAVSMFFWPNDTFAWLLSNVVGGLSHFVANYFMQRQTTEKIAKNFLVFNFTGIIGFLCASGMFALALFLVKDSNASWLAGSAVGTTTHYLLNNRAMKLDFDKLKFAR